MARRPRVAGRAARPRLRGRMMTTDEIREAYLGFFERRGHRRLPSASLVPATFDPSVLLTTAGMHPLKPYFLGLEQPPDTAPDELPEVLPHASTSRTSAPPRATSRSSRCSATSRSASTSSRAPSSTRWSCRWRASASPEDIWVTVFEGDEELGLGPDEEAIAAWEAVGIPRERIVPCPRSENFWQAGPDRALRPVQRALPRPRPAVGHRGRPARRRQRALPGVLEPRLHAVRPGPARQAHAAARQEHRHRPRPQPHGAHPAGRRRRSSRPTSSRR